MGTVSELTGGRKGGRDGGKKGEEASLGLQDSRDDTVVREASTALADWTRDTQASKRQGKMDGRELSSGVVPLHV